MPNTVNVPLFGTVSKGKAAGVLIGGVAVSGYLIYKAEKKKKDQAAAAAAAASAQAQQSAGYGYGYGTPPGSPYYGYGAGSYYGYGAGGGFPAGYYGYGQPQPPQPATNTTNAQWSQAAISQLTSEGYDAQTVSAALGNYISGQPVTADQQTIIQSAIAVEGYPPVPGANGYPPSIQTGPPGGQGGNTVPNVIGQTAGSAHNAIVGAGLIPRDPEGAVPGEANKKVIGQSPQAATKVSAGSDVFIYT